MSNRLYVGNLPFHATEELLSQRFATSGGVESVSAAAADSAAAKVVAVSAAIAVGDVTADAPISLDS